MGVPDQRGRREDRLHVLSGALRAFAEATTDYERLLNVVARTVSDVVADGCIVRLLSDGGWLTPVAVHPWAEPICPIAPRPRMANTLPACGLAVGRILSASSRK